jgi:hypothetical protein
MSQSVSETKSRTSFELRIHGKAKTEVCKPELASMLRESVVGETGETIVTAKYKDIKSVGSGWKGQVAGASPPRVSRRVAARVLFLRISSEIGG